MAAYRPNYELQAIRGSERVLDFAPLTQYVAHC